MAYQVANKVLVRLTIRRTPNPLTSLELAKEY